MASARGRSTLRPPPLAPAPGPPSPPVDAEAGDDATMLVACSMVFSSAVTPRLPITGRAGAPFPALAPEAATSDAEDDSRLRASPPPLAPTPAPPEALGTARPGPVDPAAALELALGLTSAGEPYIAPRLGGARSRTGIGSAPPPTLAAPAAGGFAGGGAPYIALKLGGARSRTGITSFVDGGCGGVLFRRLRSSSFMSSAPLLSISKDAKS